MSMKIIESEYNKKIHFAGRLTAVLVILMLISVPAIVCLHYNIFPTMSGFLKGLAMVWMIYLPICIAEVLTYTPMVGISGAYLSFISGNLSNLKIPCAAMAMDNAGVKGSTDEGDVIATLSIATSTIVTEIIIVIGVIALVPLTPVLTSKILEPAFQNILPALFGALGVYWIMRQWKLAVTPLAFVILVSILVPMFTGKSIPAGLLIPVSGLLAVLAARFMYNRGWVVNAGNE
ncbi:MAG: hypothetical protein CVV49_05145 [Spirochaetae bacterium HGW-Spirochaetae-5]|nr:MAG: hypothetical protein CVV49_05145 [Spirochaetae bacterium HGW-Spirochaetae-5]